MQNIQNTPYEETAVTEVTEPVINQPAAAPVEKNEFEETDISMQLNNADPIYKHKDGRYITKSKMLKDGFDDARIQKGIDGGFITLIGDTEDLTQQFKHKDGNIYTVQDMMNDGLTQERILKGIEIGAIVPLEKKNQVQNPLPKDISPVDAVAQVDMSTSAPPVVSPATQATASAQLNQQSQDFQALDSELKSKSTTQQRKTETARLILMMLILMNKYKKQFRSLRKKQKNLFCHLVSY